MHGRISTPHQLCWSFLQNWIHFMHTKLFPSWSEIIKNENEMIKITFKLKALLNFYEFSKFNLFKNSVDQFKLTG